MKFSQEAFQYLRQILPDGVVLMRIAYFTL
jgi:hypothetical protein